MNNEKENDKTPSDNDETHAATPTEIERAYAEYRYLLFKEDYTNGDLR